MEIQRQPRGKKFSIPRFQRGFTLIEVLLASFILMSVVTIAIGSFTSQIALQGSSQTQSNVQQTAQAIIDAISRDVRAIEAFTFEGTSASCPGSFPGCGSGLVFTTAAGVRKEYRFFPTEGVIRLCDTACATENTLNDAARVIVTNFYVEGVVPNMASRISQLVQPFAVIHLSLATPPTNRREEFASLSLRTMVASRLFDKYR